MAKGGGRGYGKWPDVLKNRLEIRQHTPALGWEDCIARRILWEAVGLIKEEKHVFKERLI